MPTEDETFLRLKRKPISQVTVEVFYSNDTAEVKLKNLKRAGYTREEYLNYWYDAYAHPEHIGQTKEEYLKGILKQYDKICPEQFD